MRHHKLFTVIYVVVVAVMLVPAFLQFANKPALVLGWPAFFHVADRLDDHRRHCNDYQLQDGLQS